MITTIFEGIIVMIFLAIILVLALYMFVTFIFNGTKKYDPESCSYVVSNECRLPPKKYDFTLFDHYILCDVIGCAFYKKIELSTPENKMRVLCVIMNRVRSENYPNNIRDVVHQTALTRHHLIPNFPKDDELSFVRAWCELYNENIPDIQVIPEEHMHYDITEWCVETRE